MARTVASEENQQSIIATQIKIIFLKKKEKKKIGSMSAVNAKCLQRKK